MHGRQRNPEETTFEQQQRQRCNSTCCSSWSESKHWSSAAVMTVGCKPTPIKIISCLRSPHSPWKSEITAAGSQGATHTCQQHVDEEAW